MSCSSISRLCLAVALTVGCTKYDPLYCDEDQRCTDPDRSFCDLTGEYPASEGVARTCIPDPNASSAPDAGSPDAGSDAGSGGADASVFTYPEPQAYWAFDQEDISGSVLVARQGGLNGAIAGPIADTAGVVADALAFAGGPDHVDFGNVMDDVLAGPDRKFTISVWIRPAAVSGEQTILVKAGASSCSPPEETRELHLLLVDGVPAFRFWTPDNDHARYLEAATPLVLDVWQHLVLTYDGEVDVGPVERVRLYVDSVSQPLTVSASLDTFPYDIQPTDAHLALANVIGASGTRCGDQKLVGALDELAVWSTVLSAEDAAEVHARGMAALALWPL
jgi:hypothetical protein